MSPPVVTEKARHDTVKAAREALDTATEKLAEVRVLVGRGVSDARAYAEARTDFEMAEIRLAAAEKELADFQETERQKTLAAYRRERDTLVEKIQAGNHLPPLPEEFLSSLEKWHREMNEMLECEAKDKERALNLTRLLADGKENDAAVSALCSMSDGELHVRREQEKLNLLLSKCGTSGRVTMGRLLNLLIVTNSYVSYFGQ